MPTPDDSKRFAAWDASGNVPPQDAEDPSADAPIHAPGYADLADAVHRPDAQTGDIQEKAGAMAAHIKGRHGQPARALALAHSVNRAIRTMRKFK